MIEHFTMAPTPIYSHTTLLCPDPTPLCHVMDMNILHTHNYMISAFN